MKIEIMVSKAAYQKLLTVAEAQGLTVDDVIRAALVNYCQPDPRAKTVTLVDSRAPYTIDSRKS